LDLSAVGILTMNGDTTKETETDFYTTKGEKEMGAIIRYTLEQVEVLKE
jgi:hypothetical protein